MSFYHAMNGVTLSVFFILPMLGKHPDEYPRFRDCFLADEEHPEYDNHIHIYTRTGGLNRRGYEEENIKIMTHPNYIANFDNNFDCTYATWVFSVPKKWGNDFLKITSGKLTEISEEYKSDLYRIFPKLEEKFDSLFDAAKNQDDTEQHAEVKDERYSAG